MKEYYKPSKFIAASFSVSLSNLKFLIGILAVHFVQITIAHVKLSSILPLIQCSFEPNFWIIPESRSLILAAFSPDIHNISLNKGLNSSFPYKYQEQMVPDISFTCGHICYKRFNRATSSLHFELP